MYGHRNRNFGCNLNLEECRLLGSDAVWFFYEDVSDKRIASIIRVQRISVIGTMLAVTSNYAKPVSHSLSYVTTKDQSVRVK
jgi:hypothetical protein